MFHWEHKLLDSLSRHILVVAGCLVGFLSLCLRVQQLEFHSTDLDNFLLPWFDQIKAGGGLAALGQPIGDYNVPYLLVMALLTYLPLEPIVSIKLVSILFDYVLAFAAGWLVYHLMNRTQRAKATGMAAGCVVLLLPTVFLNSAYWGQIDSAYTAFLLLCLSSLVRERYLPAFLWFSVAFCCKLQAVFLLPVLLLLYLCRRRFSCVLFLTIPAMLLVGNIPAFLAGRGFWETMGIYLRQTGTYPQLTMNYPNLYYFLRGEFELFAVAGIFITICLFVALTAYILARGWTITPRNLPVLSLWTMLVCLYCLPSMHERYGYPTDVLSVIYMLIKPKRWYVPIIINLSSLLSYTGFLLGYWVMDLSYFAIAKLAVLVLLTADLMASLKESNAQPQTKAGPVVL